MVVDGDTGAATAKESNTAGLVRRLVRATLARHGASEAPDAAVERLFRYAVRLVGSCLAGGFIENLHEAHDRSLVPTNRVRASA
jgi:hypothetical protein